VKKRVRLRFSGIVQGVGFRPFIYRMAASRGLTGFVLNTVEGVTVEIQGNQAEVDDFITSVPAELPPLARVTDMVVEDAVTREEEGFSILSSSEHGRPEVHISPDAATCRDCLKELFDPNDRRYRYPFINCTNCGPRLTIIHDIPYDRKNTSMQVFPLCENCRKEYEDPSNRRFHAEPNACPVCGPRLQLLNATGLAVHADDITQNTGASSSILSPGGEERHQPLLSTAGDEQHQSLLSTVGDEQQLPLLSPGGEDRGEGEEAQENSQPIQAFPQDLHTDDPIELTIRLLGSGSIVAVKGLGGFHLCADASNTAALKRLRERKYREEKPLAVMVKDLAHARMLAYLTPEDEALLSNPERPIVLVKKRENEVISGLVAPGMANLGIMLPYTPVHHLLFEGGFAALIMTSANQTDEPICIGNEEAVRRLQGIADFFLVHNRDIIVRCDDSIALNAGHSTRIMRRSRGYTPRPILLARKLPPVLALGAHLKSTVCVAKGDFAFLSPHIGDMETPEARDFFHESIEVIKRITQSDPAIIACDMHPDFYSTRLAEQMQAEKVIRVQHHHAHIVSCMAENRITGKVIGLAMDGTGYGPDATVWGGEFLVADEVSFERAGHLRTIPLPGGDAAVKQPWRIASALLMECFTDEWLEVAGNLNILPESIDPRTFESMVMKKLSTVMTSSLGRVFDAVACLIGLRNTVSFEGQAAMELEACAGDEAGDVLAYDVISDDCLVLDLLPALKRLVMDRLKGRNRQGLSSAFHRTLIHAFVRIAEEIRVKTGLNRVALSGGCFQNRILLEGCITRLSESGFEVFTHSIVPTNDGGIALGQVVVAAALNEGVAEK